jgi:cysteine desulfurase
MASVDLERAYLDYNATAPLRADARAAIMAAFELGGNPSSIHAEGRAARAAVEDARRAVGEFAGVAPRGIVFTSGGTEAANLGLAPTGRCVRLIASAGEHPCVLAGHRFPPQDAMLAPLDADGRIDLTALEVALDFGGPAMLGLQGANNETGVMQPVAEAAALVHERGGVVVCDAVQLAGRMPLDARALGADFLILSAHKFGGPKGAGALISSHPELRLGSPLLRGGGQERGARAGTENVAGIVGFGAAARLARAEAEREAVRLATLRDRLEASIFAAAPDAIVFGARAPRLPNTSCFAIPDIPAATLLMRLDLAGVAASSGSACSSGKVTRSHVLTAMGVAPDLAAGAIRLSLGWASTQNDVELFARAFAPAVASLRRRRGAA